MDADRDRPSRRRDARRAGGKAGARRKKTLCLAAETARRLAIHADATGQTESALVGQLIDTHLRRFSLIDRGAPTAPAAPTAEAGDAA